MMNMNHNNGKTLKFRVWDSVSRKMLKQEEVLQLSVRDIFYNTPETEKNYRVMWFTEKCDISEAEVHEGDIIESHLGNGQIIAGNMEIKYGTFQAYCPVDKCYMDSVGFYAAKKGYPDMPIGSLEEYAKVIGNIYESPELLEQ